MNTDSRHQKKIRVFMVLTAVFTLLAVFFIARSDPFLGFVFVILAAASGAYWYKWSRESKQPSITPATKARPKTDASVLLPLNMHRSLLGTRRKKIIAGSLAAALILLAAGTFSLVTYAEQQAIAAAEEAAQREEAAAAAAEQTADLAEAQDDAMSLISEAETLEANAGSYATAEAIAGLQEASQQLNRLTKADDIEAIEKGLSALRVAMGVVGTPQAAMDREFEASGTGGATSARAFCKSLNEFSGDPAAAWTAIRASVLSSSIPAAVQYYCPEFLPAVDYASRVIPADLPFAVGESASALGVVPKVVSAGTYRTAGASSDCYYEINNQHGTILDNNFVGSAVGELTITLSAGQGFDSHGCGNWLPK